MLIIIKAECIILFHRCSGVFDMAGDVPLQLLVDIKTDGVEYVSMLY